MSLSIRPQKERIIEEANQILSNVNMTLANLEDNEPQAFLKAEQSLEAMAQRVSHLRYRVTATRKHQQAKIPDITEQELSELEKTLNETSGLLTQAKNERLEANHHAAEDIIDLNSRMTALFSRMGSRPIQSADLIPLQRSASAIQTRGLTLGNVRTLNTISTILAGAAANAAPAVSSYGQSTQDDDLERAIAASLSGQSTQDDDDLERAIAASLQVNPIQQQPSVEQTATIHFQAMRAAQDAEFEKLEIDALDEKYSALQGSTAPEMSHPVHLFKALLGIYNTIMTLSPRTTSENRTALGELRGRVEGSIQTHIANQAAHEERARIEHEQALKKQEDRSSSLRALKAALEAAVAAGNRPSAEVTAAVQTAFSGLKGEDKTRLFQELSALLKPKTGRDLPKALQGQPLPSWDGKFQEKLAALVKIMSAEQPLPPPAAGISASMREQFNAVQDQFATARGHAPVTAARSTTASSSTSTSTASASTATSTSSTQTSSTPARAPQQPVQENVGSAAMQSLRALQALLPLLGDNTTASGLQEAMFQLTLIASNGHSSSFRISASPSTLVSDRTAYHLYFIHRNERGQLPNDAEYGRNAMIGAHPATHSDRRRAILRTIAELALETLDQAIRSADASETLAMLRLLESLEMDARDLPQGQRNIAHSLFGQMYHLHSQARQTNSSLMDPHDARFHGDFGREAFITTVEGIDLAVKRAAIQEMLNTLKAAWRI